jgi:cytoskeletal protein RodZ
MNPEDELLRKALLRDMPAPEAYRALQTLRPAMNRARARRRAALTAATAVLVFGGGAAVLAVNSSIQESRQTATSDLPPPAPIVEHAESETEPVEAPMANTPIEEPSTTASIATTTEEPAEPTTVEPAEIEPPAVVTPNAASQDAPPPALAPPSTLAPEPAERLERVESACGVLVVAVNGNQISVADLEPAEGFSARVTDSGPKSIEMKFVGDGPTCEVHVEIEHDRLHIEVQGGRSHTERRSNP